MAWCLVKQRDNFTFTFTYKSTVADREVIAANLTTLSVTRQKSEVASSFKGKVVPVI
jgi:hypothetical protein